MEDGVVTHRDLQNLKGKCNALEEAFTLFSKFTLKVTHAAATTLQLLTHRMEEEGLEKDDTKLLYNFLIKDWDKVLLEGK